MNQAISIKPVVHQLLPEVCASVIELKRVCAYCRVSTESAEQRSSYYLQVSHYQELIKSHADWAFAGIYADEGISGTSTKNRKQFKQMIQDCLDGKIDRIITKSISRFARNTLDCLEYVRKLKNLPNPVSIYFEKENIDTLDVKSELLLTILSSLAQDESRSISENVKWANQSRYQQGYVHCPTANFLGYDKDPQGIWIINEAQAQTVRRIYRECMEGYGTFSIAKHLTQDNVQTGSGRTKWSANSVHRILRNEKYCGDALMQKRITIDFLTHRRIANNGFQPQYYIENHHPAIIGREEWDAVQVELSRRYLMNHPLQQKQKAELAKVRYSNRSVFSSKLYCVHCGDPFQRRSLRTTCRGQSVRYPIWKCRNAETKQPQCLPCRNFACKEEILKESFMNLLIRMKREKAQLLMELETSDYRQQLRQEKSSVSLKETLDWFIEQLETLTELEPAIPLFRKDIFMRTVERITLSEYTAEVTFIFGLQRKIPINTK